ncbi:MAG: hypothetical protein ACI8X5_004226 [Planctomycetota bacterium]|jgi:hypothetical protein
MKTTNESRGRLQDFHGPTVWFGIALALGGFLAGEWPIGDLNFGPLMFFGGLQLGMGLMQNRYKRELEQSNSAVPADSD